MNLIDKTPGGFMSVANTVLYSVVLVEIWMITANSVFALIVTMALIVAVAGWLCHWMLDLIGPEEYTLGHELPVAVPTARPVPVAPALPAFS